MSLDDYSFTFMLLYVDDMLIVGTHLLNINDLGLAKKIIGWRFMRTRGPKDYDSHNKATSRRCWTGLA